MNLRYRSLYITLFVLLTVTLPAKAQIQLGGLADFELRKGGSDSSPYVNQTPTDKWMLYTPSIRLFANANISDNWFISSALQSDYYDGKELGAPFFSIINLNWIPQEESNFTITAGRFVTPYGIYSERVLSSDNPFVHFPLSHSSGLPVSKELGILDNSVSYGVDVTGLSMVYQRMYSQGIRINNKIGESEWLRYELAATLSPVSSYFDIAQYNTPSFIGRLVFQPRIWGQLGLSFSTGPFMSRDAINSESYSDADSFQQLAIGTDLEISYHYYTFVMEYNWSQWEAPYVVQQYPVGEATEASVNHISAEAVVNFPFFVGGYSGIRYEHLISGDISSGSYSSGQSWTYDRQRLEMLLGYKLHRNITLKASYLYSTDKGPGLNDDVLAIQLSVAY